MFAATLLPGMSSQKMKPVRSTIYIIAGISCALPAFHVFMSDSLYLYPFNLTLWIVGGIFYLIGAFIYAMRFPEAYFPKKFDYIGNSHNIFHV